MINMDKNFIRVIFCINAFISCFYMSIFLHEFGHYFIAKILNEEAKTIKPSILFGSCYIECRNKENLALISLGGVLFSCIYAITLMLIGLKMKVKELNYIGFSIFGGQISNIINYEYSDGYYFWLITGIDLTILFFILIILDFLFFRYINEIINKDNAKKQRLTKIEHEIIVLKSLNMCSLNNREKNQ